MKQIEPGFGIPFMTEQPGTREGPILTIAQLKQGIL